MRTMKLSQAFTVLEAVAAHAAPGWKSARMLHAAGDGTFIVDGRRLNRRQRMAAKIPVGV